MQEGCTKKLLRKQRVSRDGDHISRVNHTAESPEQDKRSLDVSCIKIIMTLKYQSRPLKYIPYVCTCTLFCTLLVFIMFLAQNGTIYNV